MYPQMSSHRKRTGEGVSAGCLLELREVYMSDELNNRRDDNRSLWNRCEWEKQGHRIAISVRCSKRPTVILIYGFKLNSVKFP